jgi:hypothetical protein
MSTLAPTSSHANLLTDSSTSSQQAGGPGGAQEGDRGLLGAMGGAAAGGFAGHKAGGHGFLGAVGGAILGSLAEDFAKDRKKGSHSPQPGAGGYGDSGSSFFGKN